jgi:cytochrome c2
MRYKGGTMKHLERIVLGLPLLAAMLAIGASVAIGQTDSSQQKSQNKSTPKAVKGGNQDRGQQVFEQNCSRCHHAPEGFSSGISGTVAMHMRVHASLSEADYKALRQFLNP